MISHELARRGTAPVRALLVPGVGYGVDRPLLFHAAHVLRVRGWSWLEAS